MIDLNVVQAAAQAIIIMAAMVIILMLSKALPGWITLCFELLLLSILVRRIDDLGNWLLHVDLISTTFNLVISWSITVVLLVAFAQIFRRRYEIKRIEAGMKARVEYLETLRRNSERVQSWDHQTMSKLR